MSTVIRFVLSNYSLTFFVLGLVCAAIALAARRSPMSEALLGYYCLMAIGVCNLYNFVMHVFFAPLSAHFIGWPNSPFQYEVGFASLGFGVVGLLAFRKDFGLRLAAVLGPACFLWGAAGGHTYQMAAHQFLARECRGCLLDRSGCARGRHLVPGRVASGAPGGFAKTVGV
jgi:hypothetical protein